jgi:hypothetical protein
MSRADARKQIKPKNKSNRQCAARSNRNSGSGTEGLTAAAHPDAIEVDANPSEGGGDAAQFNRG